MPSNPLLAEIYAAREKLLEDAGGDVHRYLEGVREREAASGRLLKLPSTEPSETPNESKPTDSVAGQANCD